MGRPGATRLRRREDGICAVADCQTQVAPTGARCHFHKANGVDKPTPTWPRPLKPAEHGTMLRYQRGCRCCCCRAENTRQAAEYRSARRAS